MAWLVVLGAAAPAPGAARTGAASIADKTRSMQHMPGLLTLHWDAKAGKLYLEIPLLNRDLLYLDSLPYGAGSNDLGLDRGEISEARIVRFERVGEKILLLQPNERFGVSSSDPAEQLALRQSFAESVLAGFKIEAEDPATAGKEGSVLVDATEFFARDAHHVAETLAQHQKESYKLDAARSSLVPEATRAFPKNVEVESLLTFTADVLAPSGFVRDVAPDPHALTVRERQSFVELPGPGFQPRDFDPRAGYFGVTHRDYAAPLGAPLEHSFIARHRLLKRDPACTSACVAQQPIQYYVDRGAPEPIRSALLEGARWWDQAFQSAGWAPGTFRVDLLPVGADPMDVRYNIIQWVHRYTRGWSYGEAVTDPRTGEIIKGNVTLGSLRGRQDYLVAESLLAPYTSEGSLSAQRDPLLQLVLSRLRQLAAHETGHTLGLMHNFAASAFPHRPEDTVSVMDYPHPWVTLTANGVPDVSQAYGVGIGSWDKVAIDFGYREFPPQSEESAGLARILAAAAATGLEYITDDDARPLGGAHPHAHLWDNGVDPADELNRIMAVRTAALARFGANAVRPGAPVAQLEDTLVPLFLLHRYQTEAAIKEIGGLDYRYQLRGDGQMSPRVVAAAEQRKALGAVLNTLSSEALTLPESLLQILPPRPPGLARTRESFPASTGLTFDPVAVAECAADLTLKGLLDPQRAARLTQYHARDPQSLSFKELLERTLLKTRPAPNETDRAPDSLAREIKDAIYVRTVEALLALAADPTGAAAVRAAVFEQLAGIKAANHGSSAIDAYVALRIEQLQRSPEKFLVAAPIEAPPGMPIGSDED